MGEAGTIRPTLWRPAEYRRIAHGDRQYLFLIGQTSLVEVDESARMLLESLEQHGPLEEAELISRLNDRYSAQTTSETLRELFTFGAVQPVAPASAGGAPHPAPQHPAEADAGSLPVQTLVLSISHACNLACTYCYADGGDYGGPKRLMTAEVARDAIDFLVKASGNHPTVQVIFFGGEPLLNWPLIQETVLYTEEAAARAGKQTEFALTTNGTLLTEAICRFCDEHRIGVNVSLDGPREEHDANRPLLGGGGSYDQAAEGVRLAVNLIKSKPVACRVTVTHGFGDLEASFHHLIGLGFHEVGFAPVTSGVDGHSLNAQDLKRMTAHFQALSQQFLAAAKEGRFFGFSNLLNVLWDFHSGSHKVYPCGGGIGFFAVDPAGKLGLCHRFTGDETQVYGDIYQGIDAEKQAELLRHGHVATKSPCQTCWARYLCAGGCYHEAQTRHGDPWLANTHYCHWLKSWLDWGMKIYLTMGENHPEFLSRLFDARIPYPDV